MEKLVAVIIGLVVVAGIVLGVIFVGAMSNLLGAYVIQDIANLYNLDVVANMPLIQIFGAMMIVGILKHNIKKAETKDKDEDSAKKIFSTLGNTALTYLISWGVAYLFHYFFMQVMS